MAPMDRLFGVCLIAGFVLSVGMAVLGGRLRWLKAPRVLRAPPRLRIPRLRLRARIPKVRAPRVAALAARPAVIPPGAGLIFVGLGATLFGAVGLICHANLGWSVAASLGAAGGVAVAVTTAATVGVWRFLLSGDEASELRGGSPIGRMGHVSLAIPEGGTGSIAFVAEGKRVTMPARSKTGEALPQRADVIIADVREHAAVVERFDGLV